MEPSNGLCPGTYLLGRDTEIIHRGNTTNLGCVQPAAHTCTCWLAVAADNARTTEGSKYRLGWAEYGVNGPAYPPQPNPFPPNPSPLNPSPLSRQGVSPLSTYYTYTRGGLLDR